MAIASSLLIFLKCDYSRILDLYTHSYMHKCIFSFFKFPEVIHAYQKGTEREGESTPQSSVVMLLQSLLPFLYLSGFGAWIYTWHVSQTARARI